MEVEFKWKEFLMFIPRKGMTNLLMTRNKRHFRLLEKIPRGMQKNAWMCSVHQTFELKGQITLRRARPYIFRAMGTYTGKEWPRLRFRRVLSEQSPKFVHNNRT